MTRGSAGIYRQEIAHCLAMQFSFMPTGIFLRLYPCRANKVHTVSARCDKSDAPQSFILTVLIVVMNRDWVTQTVSEHRSKKRRMCTCSGKGSKHREGLTLGLRWAWGLRRAWGLRWSLQDFHDVWSQGNRSIVFEGRWRRLLRYRNKAGCLPQY